MESTKIKKFEAAVDTEKPVLCCKNRIITANESCQVSVTIKPGNTKITELKTGQSINFYDIKKA
jgi:hypothetical protein